MRYKYIVLSVFVLVFLLALIYVFVPPKIVVKNKEAYIGIKYNANYDVTRFGINYNKRTKVKNKVNYKKLGTYDVVFNTKIGFKNHRQVKKVSVLDTVFPQIVLNGKYETYVCPNTEYKDEKALAYDDYDGDLTSKVESNVKENKVIYSVRDSSGNKTKKSRKLIYDDITKPEIKLKGTGEVVVYSGEAYTEAGVSAIDNCDGDITSKVVTSGNVDTSKLGTYTLTYSVVDSHNNSSDVKRIVRVITKPVNNSGGKGGVIYLTFDDGPLQGTTNVILDVLKEEGVKATFFVTKNGPDNLIKREFDEGHTVALHTWSHDYGTVYSSVDGYFNDLGKISDRVKRITGVESKIIRFPGGASNTVSKKYSPGIMSKLTKEVSNRGYVYFDWNISSGDAGQTTAADGVYNNVTRNLSRSRANIVLMHDIKTYTRDAIRRIIKYGKDNGYAFDRLTMDTAPYHQSVNN